MCIIHFLCRRIPDEYDDLATRKESQKGTKKKKRN